MFGSNSRIERIKAEAKQELDGKDEQLANQLWDWTYLVFQKWKLEHGDRNPIPNRGMLFDLLPIPFDKAEPWECVTGIFLPSPVGLALKLWREDYAPFKAITDKVGVSKVLAVLIVRFADKTNDDDMDTAYEVLSKHNLAMSVATSILDNNRDAITAHQSRITGGNSRGKQLTAGKADKYKLIRDATKELSPTTKPRNLNKAIAKKTGLETDYVRKARKEMKQKTDGS